MAQWHLDDLENELQQIGWKIILREEGIERPFWVIKRKFERVINFLLDDSIYYVQNHPMLFQDTYGCVIDVEGEHWNTCLIFYKKGETWDEDLRKFIIKLNTLD